MWRRLKNLLISVSTYADLSPDLRIRQRVRRLLRGRAHLAPQEWYATHWQPLKICPALSDFLFSQLVQQTKLDIGRVLPGDRLVADLSLPLICWFDWEMTFAEAFYHQFGVDLGEGFSIAPFETVEEWMLFLHRQIPLAEQASVEAR